MEGIKKAPIEPRVSDDIDYYMAEEAKVPDEWVRPARVISSQSFLERLSSDSEDSKSRFMDEQMVEILREADRDRSARERGGKAQLRRSSYRHSKPGQSPRIDSFDRSGFKTTSSRSR